MTPGHGCQRWVWREQEQQRGAGVRGWPALRGGSSNSRGRRPLVHASKDRPRWLPRLRLQEPNSRAPSSACYGPPSWSSLHDGRPRDAGAAGNKAVLWRRGCSGGSSGGTRLLLLVAQRQTLKV